MNTRALLPVIAAGGFLAWGGCTFPSSSTVVPRKQANQIQTADYGTILKVREVTIEGRRTHIGQAGGALVGIAAAAPSDGSRGGRDRQLAQAGAAIVGSVVGEAVEEAVTRKVAQEITVQMKDGRIVVITQESPPLYRVGDEVQVIHSPAGARVAMATDY